AMSRSPRLPRAVRPAARAALAATLALAAPLAAQSPRAAAASSAARLQRDIAWLADDAREGRFTGSPGNDSAAAYIARRFAALGLRPVVADGEREARCAAERSAVRTAAWSPAGEPPRCAGYLQRFTARSIALAHAGRPSELATQNVVAFLPGTDPTLRGQVVVLGAHFDHLGRDSTFATDVRAGHAIRNGADDNASGTAAVMELARLLAARPTRRSVLFVAFSGEELGLLGSRWFVEHAPVPVDSMVAMLNFDMVGRLTNDKLLVYGTATAAELPALLDSANAAGPKLAVKGIGDGLGPSDHSSFYAKDRPVLHFFTDQHADYHAATDDAERINVPGTARVVDLAERVVRALGDRPAPLTFQRAPTTQRMASGPDGPQGPRPWLGSIPDMSADDAPGMRLQGVSPGSPADKAGLKAGDVVVEMDGKAITDLYSYTDALYAHKPGDVVPMVVLRTGAAGGAPERVSVTVTLGQRGG
ncbi:MAG TPA: M20/M25/M40 family metallo-hydrolase, partial [Gemmatirosa sp.]|nr:M20/M25/M40 family metallo-hydrolase [Gemmatirosa sp.]